MRQQLKLIKNNKMGGIFFGFIGAFVRWLFSGFKKKFSDIYRPETIYENVEDIASEEMKNVIIGFVFIIGIIYLTHITFNLW